MKAVFLIGRLVFGGFFFVAGWNHLTHHAAMARMVARGGIPMPELAVIGSGLMILIVGASILLGWYPRTGCVLIAIFLAVVTPLAHNFWNTHTAAEQGEALNNFTFAIANEAKKQGIPFAGHVPSAVDAVEASAAGQRSMEHLDQILESCSSRSRELFQVPGKDWSSKYDELTLDTFDEVRFKTLVATLARNQTWQVPTLVRKRVHGFRGVSILTEDNRLRYMPAAEVTTWKSYFPANENPSERAIAHKLWQKQLDLIRTMHDAGVPFLAGTDLGGDYIFPGFSLHDELVLFVQAGLTPGEALKTATYNPPKFLGMLDRFGTVGEGKLADLVLLDANPLEDIHNTQKIRAVVLNGRYFDRTSLDKLLANAASNASTH
jgi:uncharacterized membrane protein YphA (DoxX/SURF4 family)